ncbi:MAG: CDP-alcohol phosphatidyltransferase family protein [Chloroflexi bacterium]|nr:CDP-alcohol phosphatidyltransferase family protein [Chloroflexota bacterium]
MTEHSLVPPETRARIKSLAVPVALAVGRAGLTPNALTVIGFGGVCVSAALAATGNWVAAGVIGLLFAAFDMLDGALARATARVSRFGAFLDSTLDRAGEGVLYAGIVAGTVATASALPTLAALAMVAAFLVSYTRARAEGLGFGGDVGVAPRAERVVIMGVGLIVTGLAGGVATPVGLFRPREWVDLPGGARILTTGGQPWLAATLAILFTLSTITVLQRIWHVRAQARRAKE